MLIKAFELKNEFPFDMEEGTVYLDKERLIPTSMHRSAAVKAGCVVVKPGIGDDIRLFGVTHGPYMRMVVFSSATATRYYWFTRKRRYSYKVPTGSNDLNEAWVNLFKSFMLDSRASTLLMYDVLKHFVLEFLRTLNGTEFEYDLSGRWLNDLVHVRVKKESFFTKQLTVTVDGVTRTCDLNKHPLIEMGV